MCLEPADLVADTRLGRALDDDQELLGAVGVDRELAPGSSSKRTVAVLAVPVALWTGKLTRRPGAAGASSNWSRSKAISCLLLSIAQ